MFNPTSEKSKLISRRSIILSVGKLAALSVLGARMYHLQIVEGAKYRNLAEGNRIKLVPVIPRRGLIKDRNDQIIAEGISRYQLVYNPQRGKNPKENLIKIAKLIQLPKDKLDELLNALDSKATRFPLVIENFLSWENIARVKVRERDLPEFKVNFIESRFYPYQNITSHITGYVGIVNDIEQKNQVNIEKYGELLKEQNFRIGKTGIELSMQDKLAGKAGVTEVEVDSRGRAIREISYKQDVRGNDLKLTLDMDLQSYLHSILKGKGGLAGEGASAVLLDVESGDIMAMCSVPDYNANSFIKGIKAEDLKNLYSNPDKPFTNKAISKTYPAGSTFKTIVATAALNEGVIGRGTSIYCQGHLYFGGRRFHCWKEGGHGSLSVEGALEQSCNVFFYEVARLLGIQKIADYARKLGLGNLTGIELPFEEAGIIPDPAWKRKTLKQPWYEGETLNTGIGQGYVEVTPLQLALSAARLATGKNVEARMTLPDGKPNRRIFSNIQGLKSDKLAIVQNGMNLVINGNQGTARASKIYESNFTFAGKTGSAQYKAIDRNIKIKRDSDTHSLFMGYGPVGRPRFSVGVIVEFGGGGSKSAAPIARDILNFAFQKYLG
ncbi:MAG: penicillin-binding protein 2 [Rickettsiales bacterium]|nr:penicillin-binding protein 2 [Rickettsiales bacterium]